MMTKESSSNTIPQDLIYVILSRLPPKSIYRFRCVSKQWKSIICSQYFKELYHTISSSNPRHLILVADVDGRPVRFFSSPQPESSLSLVVASDVRNMFSGNEIPFNYNLFCHGSCYYCEFKCKYVSGLIYFPGKKAHALCNPSMGYAIHYLPPAPKCCGMLGYDPIGKQFKVLIYKEICYDELVYYILTIGTENEKLREIKCPVTFLPTYFYDQICINGVLYYIANKQGEAPFIVCFDVRSEKFKFLYPNFLDYEIYTKLINYMGKLCQIGGKYGGNYGDDGGFPYKICMWVLEDVEKEVWKNYVYTLKGTENTFFDDKLQWFGLVIDGATTSGDIVIRQNPRYIRQLFYVLYFNPERNTLRCVEIKDVSEDEKLLSERYGHEIYSFVDHIENLGFDFMKTAYAESSEQKQVHRQRVIFR